MVVEEKVLPFFEWLLPSQYGGGALLQFVVLVAVLGAVGILIGYLIAAVRHGPIEAFFLTSKVLFNGFAELLRVRPSRLWAMSRLSFQEAIRRRVLVGFVLFVLLLLFAAWMLNRNSDHPATLSISFVLVSTNYLVLVMALLLSAFSLPRDISNRTIHTVVTKPVLAWEILLGRILGFAAVGTLMLVGMGVLSYLFVVRGLRHDHRVAQQQLEPIVSDSGDVLGKRGKTSLHRRLRHRHDFQVNQQGAGSTENVKDHWHPIVRDEAGVYRVGPAKGWMQARSPVYGRLRFLDRGGQPVRKGVNVGNEWTYRSFIEGGTGATAIWKFEGISETMFPDDALPIEMTIRVFRTYKGEIERGIAGTMVLKNPDTGLECFPIGFTAREFTVDQKNVPRKLKTAQGREIDLFNDLVSAGELEIHIQCEERAQYYGMADADLYLRAKDGWFWANFFKGYLSIWFQMVLVISFGVMFSTMVSGPVAMMASIAAIVIGYFTDFIVGVATGDVEGGGPLESMYRLFTQKNVVSDLDEGVTTSVMQGTDVLLMLGMRLVAALLPDYAGFDTTKYVAYGYNIQTALMGQHLSITLAYVLVVTLLGYFLLRTREIAA
jgi:hypothetical protein